MTALDDLCTPALVIDLDKLEANIERMAEKCHQLGVSLRPHIKTHKCVEIARMQQEAGCQGLTVSTLHEARVFADHGFEDLTWAYPVILNRLPEIRELSERVTLRLAVDSEEVIDALEGENYPFHVWLKVDCGYHRAGVDPASPLAETLARRLIESARLRFDGLLTHSGHAYHTDSPSALREVAEQERRVMVDFADHLRQEGAEIPAISVGSTPAMSAVENLEGIDEARPGNYVFYDFMQVDLGSCRVEDCAVTVVASVISSQPNASHCVVDAGALVLSKDTGPPNHEPGSMGEIFDDYVAGYLSPGLRLRSLSQEHGIASLTLPVGSRVRILPNHSCLTVACFDEYAVVRGEKVVDRWQIWRGRS